MADEPRSFDPTTIEANLGREQGLGVGQRELDAQRDPDQVPQTPLELGNDDEPQSREPDDEAAVVHANHGGKTEAGRRAEREDPSRR